MDLETIKQKILALTKSHWDNTHKAYLISKLGGDLGSIRYEILQLTGLKLQQFILHHMKDSLRVLPSPQAPDILGLFPNNAVLTEDVTPYFQFYTENLPARSPTPRYDFRFWAAFAKPLAIGFRRFITVNPPYIRFFDIPEGNNPSPDQKEIPAVLIPPEGIPERSQNISKNIETWCSDYGVSKDSLIVSATQSKNTDIYTATQHRDATHLVERSLLHEIIDRIDEKDLYKIVIPFNVIAQLLRSRGKF